jgi:methyl-accepting chemotaxis protein
MITNDTKAFSGEVSSSPRSKTDQKKKAVYWILIFFTVAAVASLVQELLVTQHPNPINLLVGTLSPFLMLGIYFLIRKNHSTLALVILLSYIFLVTAVGFNLQTAGVGYLFGFQIFFFGMALSLLMIPRERIAKAILLSNGIGFLAILMDYFGPAARPLIGAREHIALLVIVTIVMLATGWQAARQWPSYSLSAKLILAAITASLFVQMTVNLAFFIILTNDMERNPAEMALLQTVSQQIHLASGVGMLLASFFGLFIAYLVATPINHIISQVNHMAKTGDLTCEIAASSQDEIGHLALSLCSLMAYLKKLAGTADALASGDLSVSSAPLTSQDELGIAFSKMVEEMRGTLTEVANNVSQLSDTSTALAFDADRSRRATVRIGGVIEEIAGGLSQQTEAITRSSKSMETMNREIQDMTEGALEQKTAIECTAEAVSEMSQMITQVVLNIQTVSDDAAAAQVSAAEGAEKVGESIQEMVAIQQKVNQSMTKVQDLGRRSEKIGLIVETIEDLAGQTNLLALNAAIEAARAGENGKGFAVVADEVRKLAERSSQSTREIGDLIRGIRSSVDDLVMAMGKSTQEVGLGVERASDASGALDDIIRAVTRVNAQVSEGKDAVLRIQQSAEILMNAMDAVSEVVTTNTNLTKKMAGEANNIQQMVDSIAGVSQKNSAAVEEVSATTEEITNQARDVADMANTTADIAKTLHHVVAGFTLPAAE